MTATHNYLNHLPLVDVCQINVRWIFYEMHVEVIGQILVRFLVKIGQTVSQIFVDFGQIFRFPTLAFMTLSCRS